MWGGHGGGRPVRCRKGKNRARRAPFFPGFQQQVSPQTVPQLQLQLQLLLQPQPQPQPQLQFPQEQPLQQPPQEFPLPQEFPQELPQQQNRTRMTMIHRQELLFPLLKHIADTSLKDFGIFYAPGF